MKLSVGVDLRKTQFTVCIISEVISEDRRVRNHYQFSTKKRL